MESSTDPFFWWTDLGQFVAARELSKRPIGMTIGNFDGVHRGHQRLLENIVNWADSRDGLALVLTFNPHPAQVLHPEKRHTRVFDYEDQKIQLRKAGVGAVLVQEFSLAFSQQGPAQFFQDFVLDRIAPTYIAIGHDFHFGKNKEGSHEFLQQLCQQRGVEFQAVSAFTEGGQVVSTSNIRRALSEGDPILAGRMLGRLYTMRGIVEKGEQRGRQLGFPTANIRPTVGFHPRMGVYATWCWVDGQRKKSATNIGINKTFAESQPAGPAGTGVPIKIETHLLDEDRDLYGQEIQIEFAHFLREEKKFSGIAELKKQIQLDCHRAREVLI